MSTESILEDNDLRLIKAAHIELSKKFKINIPEIDFNQWIGLFPFDTNDPVIGGKFNFNGNTIPVLIFVHDDTALEMDIVYFYNDEWNLLSFPGFEISIEAFEKYDYVVVYAEDLISGKKYHIETFTQKEIDEYAYRDGNESHWAIYNTTNDPLVLASLFDINDVIDGIISGRFEEIEE